MDPALQAVRVARHFGGRPVLRDVSLRLDAGERVAIVGPSGCGKSTLLRCLAGLDAPSEGRILWGDTDVYAARRVERRSFHQQVQLVLQDAVRALNPAWSVLRLVREPLDILRADTSPVQRDRIATAWLRRMQLPPDLATRKPGELSGGQRQRVLLARALAIEPRFLLLDEALNGLPATLQAELLAMLADLQSQSRTAILMVTHRRAMAAAFASRILHMEDGALQSEEENLPLPSIKTLAEAP